jgi:aarF domain-containing kinase
MSYPSFYSARDARSIRYIFFERIPFAACLFFSFQKTAPPSNNDFSSSGRTIAAGIMVSYDYKTLPEDETSPGYKELKAAVHERSAQRMLAVCRKNAGVYTKAGQHIASLNYIVPPQYTDILGVLTDKAPFMPIEEVNGVLLDEFGAEWQSLFSSFDETPIAAASLAQVHHGTLPGGQEVAIKVQFPSVRRQLKMDLATISLCTRIVGYLFPKFQFTWVLPEFKIYMNQEINFENEVANNLTIKGQFADQPQFATPNVYPKLCTKKVVVMEWINGCKMNDVAAIRGMGFHEREVAELILENFADQVFVHGCK